MYFQDLARKLAQSFGVDQRLPEFRQAMIIFHRFVRGTGKFTLHSVKQPLQTNSKHKEWNKERRRSVASVSFPRQAHRGSSEELKWLCNLSLSSAQFKHLTFHEQKPVLSNLALTSLHEKSGIVRTSWRLVTGTCKDFY